MLETRQKLKDYVWFIVAWIALSSCVLFFAMTSRFTFYLVNDKVTHATVFFLLTLVLGWQAKDRRKLALVSIALFIAGCGIELAQTFTPHRHASLGDVVANVTGLACGFGVVFLSRTQQLPTLKLASSSTTYRTTRRVNLPKRSITRRRKWSDPNPHFARIRRKVG